MHYFVVILETTEVKRKPESLSWIDSGRLGKASPSVSGVKTELVSKQIYQFWFSLAIYIG